VSSYDLLDITSDSSENIYTAGSIWQENTEFTDYFVTKYDSSGNQTWFAVYNGDGNQNDYSQAITVDNNGFVYVTGTSNNLDSQDCATLKYNSLGVLQWQARYDGPDGGHDGCGAIAVDTTGNVYVTGYTNVLYNDIYSSDYLTIKYNSDGELLWDETYHMAGGEGTASGMVIDSTGNIFVTGSYSYDGNTDYVTVNTIPTEKSSRMQAWRRR